MTKLINRNALFAVMLGSGLCAASNAAALTAVANAPGETGGLEEASVRAGQSFDLLARSPSLQGMGPVTAPLGAAPLPQTLQPPTLPKAGGVNSAGSNENAGPARPPEDRRNGFFGFDRGFRKGFIYSMQPSLSLIHHAQKDGESVSGMIVSGIAGYALYIPCAVVGVVVGFIGGLLGAAFGATRELKPGTLIDDWTERNGTIHPVE